jgi:hypothetical protein
VATFAHLTSEKNAKLILRAGIRRRRSRVPEGRVVFALPVTRNYYISNQWVRELKRSGQRTIVAVHFTVPDEQQVLVGRYNAKHEWMTAAQAVAVIMKVDNAEGYEVMIPRRIDSREIRSVRSVNQVTGWRYFPGSHGKPPFCGCSYCMRGEIKGRKIRDAYEAKFGKESA